MLEKNIEDTGEVGFLDIAVVAAENWLLLLLAPVIAGLMAFGFFSFATPQTYDSVALIRITPTDAAMIASARTLTPALVGSDYLRDRRGSLSVALQDLTENALTVSKEGDSDLHRVMLSYKSAEGAQDLLTRIVDSLVANSTPAASDAALIAIRIEQTRRAIAELEANLERTNRLAESMEGGAVLTGATIGELGQTLVALIASIEERYTRLFQLEESLNGSVSAEDVIQPATLPDSPRANAILSRSLLVAFGVGLASVFFAIAAAGWKNASGTADGLRKIARIRRAFWLQPRT